MVTKDPIIKAESIKQLYMSLMDSLVNQNINSKHLVLFDSIPGTNYHSNNIELLVVGRANNGWDNYFNPANEKAAGFDKELYRNARFEYIEKRADLLSTLTSLKNKTGKVYNFNRSQFWRVTKRIAKSITKKDSDEALNSVCYSNLYKAAYNGANPDPQIIKATQEINISILEKEIELYAPKRVLFLTGYNWARPFIEKFQVEQIDPTIQDLNYRGTYKGIEVIVADHPQGKDEDKIVKAIRTAWGITSAHINS